VIALVSQTRDEEAEGLAWEGLEEGEGPQRRRGRAGGRIAVKTLEWLVKVFDELKKGPKTPDELVSKLGISRSGALDRVLDCLVAMGLAYKGKDGRYRLEHWQVFLDGEGYKLKLEHSRKLMEKFIERSDVIRPMQWDMTNPHVLQHLQSGYPEAYGKYEEWVKSEEAHREAEEAFEDAVSDFAARKGFKVVDYEKLEAEGRQVSHYVFGAVKAYLEFKDWEKMRIVVKEEKVWDDYRGVALARGGQLVKDVEELLKGLLGSEEVRKAFARLEEAERRKSEALHNYEEELMRLALKVEHGEPLRGFCELCQRVVVKERP
jgi:hypothetical protein